MKILSIDFDYFIDVGIDTRTDHFPTAGGELSADLNDIVWSSKYADARYQKFDLCSVDVFHDDLEVVSAIIARQNRPRCLISDSHAHAYEFIKEVAGDTPATVYNIDYHHDTEIVLNGEVHCGNWLRKLMDESIVKDAYWINREDSNLDRNLCEIIPLVACIDMDFDAVVLCRSSWWTPPHLDKVFIKELALLIASDLKWRCRCEKNVMTNRYNDKFRVMIDGVYDQLAVFMEGRGNRAASL